MPGAPAPAPPSSTPSGRCLGYGRAGGGNPTSAGIANAVAAAGSGGRTGPGRPPMARSRRPSLAVIALAGEKTAGLRASRSSARLAALGFGPVLLEPDLLGIFHSGTHLRRRVRHGRRHRDRGRTRRRGPAGPGRRRPRVAAGRRRRRLLDRPPGGPGGGGRARRSGPADGVDRAPAGQPRDHRDHGLAGRARSGVAAARVHPLRLAAGAVVPVRAAGVPRPRGSGGPGDPRRRVVGADRSARGRTRPRIWPARSSSAAAC